jgi:hypothetical protein
MESNRDQFLKEMSDLRKLISFYNSEIKLLSDFEIIELTPLSELVIELSTQLKEIHVSKRQFNYNSIIISLYGSFEKFIENTIGIYIDSLNAIILEYDKLPDAILASHFRLSVSLLTKIGSTKYAHLKKEDIIRDLHTCLNTKESYQLNKDVFSQHDANFKFSVIDQVFSRIGIPTISAQVLEDAEFNDYIRIKLEKNENDLLIPEDCFVLLNDLAERRNDVAHGVPGEILQNEILLDYIEHLEFYAKSVTEIIIKEYLRYEVIFKAKEMGNVTNLYHNGSVVCVMTNKNRIRLGDKVIGTNEATIVKATIVSIQYNESAMDEIDDQDDYEIGIKIDKQFKPNFTLHILPVEIVPDRSNEGIQRALFEESGDLSLEHEGIVDEDLDPDGTQAESDGEIQM